MLTSSQLSEWEAYDKIDPIGTWRDDFRMAFLSSLLTNLAISIHGKKGAKMVAFTDYMPNWLGEEKETQVQSVEDMKQILYGIARVQNKKVKDGSKPIVKKTKK